MLRRAYLSSRAAATAGEGSARTDIAARDPRVWPCDCRLLRTDLLAQQHPFEQDARIRFVEDTHTYYIDGVKAPASVTGFAHAPFPAFDAQATIATMASRHNYGDLTDRQIALQWKERGNVASSLGTCMHAAIEVYLNTGYWSKDPRIQPELRMAADFLQTEVEGRGLEVYRTEPTIYVDPKTSPGGWMLPGSVDCICRDPKTNQFWVLDWKRVQGLDKTYGFGEPPFDELDDSKASQYSIQLHIYRYILVNYYGLDVPEECLYMVTFHPDNGRYQMIQAKPVAHLVKHMMDNPDVYMAKIAEHKAIEERNARWMAEAD